MEEKQSLQQMMGKFGIHVPKNEFFPNPITKMNLIKGWVEPAGNVIYV